MVLWIYLHFPHLQLDALFGNNQEHPVVIVESQRCRIIQYNETAEQQALAKYGLRQCCVFVP